MALGTGPIDLGSPLMYNSGPRLFGQGSDYIAQNSNRVMLILPSAHVEESGQHCLERYTRKCYLPSER